MDAQIINVKGIEYTVISIVPCNPDQYPNRAKYISATAYMKRGNGKTVYSLPVDHDGTIRTKFAPINCGAFSAEDVDKLTK